ncbi:hypothetical protein HPB50_008874 [Hyalomma asiaticum]|uniref:Uncharacterized protein n=1 Tax=Hyalomma asiaticum TaxID=266040 RepID=A0ACB7THC6_HYAAI|nr:hypothetical protein HPB50_008874 [Hyalomma asiaticum]
MRGSSIGIGDGGKAGAGSRWVRLSHPERSGFSRRPAAMSDVVTKGGGDASDVLDGLEALGSDSSPVDSFDPLTPISLKRQLRKGYGRPVMELLTRYFRALYDLSAYVNKVAFLNRCRSMNVVPAEYRVQCPDINNTRHIIRLLGICSYKLMLQAQPDAQGAGGASARAAA